MRPAATEATDSQASRRGASRAMLAAFARPSAWAHELNADEIEQWHTMAHAFTSRLSFVEAFEAAMDLAILHGHEAPAFSFALFASAPALHVDQDLGEFEIMLRAKSDTKVRRYFAPVCLSEFNCASGWRTCRS